MSFEDDLEGVESDLGVAELGTWEMHVIDVISGALGQAVVEPRVRFGLDQKYAPHWTKAAPRCWFECSRGFWSLRDASTASTRLLVPARVFIPTSSSCLSTLDFSAFSLIPQDIIVPALPRAGSSLPLFFILQTKLDDNHEAFPTAAAYLPNIAA